MSLIKNVNHSVKDTLKINRVIAYLILADFFIISSWGLVNPIFAVYITGQIKGAGVETVGLAATIYFLFKSGLQIPIASVIDKIKGERDDFLAMLIGMTVVGLVPLFYIFINTIPQLFLVQAIYGIGEALTYPSWMALFTRHIDKQKEGREWSLYYTIMDLAGAGAAAVGGYLVKYFGFRWLFLINSVLIFMGILLSFRIKEEFRKV